MSKRNLIITRIVRAIIVISMAVSIGLGLFSTYGESDGSHHFMNAFTCLLMLILTRIPSYISSRTRLIVPTALQTMFVIFTFLAMYFGEIFNCYERFPWWDVMLHSMSGFMLGLLGYLLLYSLNDDRRIFFHMNSFCVMLFAFCFALACGALWEVFEFAGDFLLGMNMQKSVYVTDVQDLAPYINRWGRFMDPGLIDSMKDLIVDSIGALVAVVGGYLYSLHEGKSRTLLQEIEAENMAHLMFVQEIEQRRAKQKKSKQQEKNGVSL